jgi:hypothetical protein
MRIVFLLPMIGAIIGGLIVMLTIASGGNAPQEAAGYAMACAFAVVPYVLAKSIQIMYEDSPSKLTEKVVEAIRTGPATPRE